jgi:plasmid maintenance system killer protein
MEISFTNKKLAKLLNSEKDTLRKYGSDNGKRIRLRLSQLAAVENLQELASFPQIRLHQLTGNRNEQLSIDVKHPYRLLVVPNHEEIPRKPDGGLDWQRITAVTVMEITDTH